MTPHTFRRSYMSYMVAAGYDLPYIQAQVGHRNPSTTLAIYAQVIGRPDRDQLRVEMRQLFAPIAPPKHRHSLLPHEVRFRSSTRPISEPDPSKGPEKPARFTDDHPQSKPHGAEIGDSQDLLEWRDPDSNRGHHGFQPCALPAELSRPAGRCYRL